MTDRFSPWEKDRMRAAPQRPSQKGGYSMPRYGVPYVIDLAQKLRQRETRAERLLWEHLRHAKLEGFKFRRQHPMGRFILDFYCVESKLAIELDGKYHEQEEIQRYDAFRQRMIEQEHIVFLRFDNEEVIDNIETVLSKILSMLHERADN
jgi:very-short-patch-repair endonuclease